MQSWRRTWGQDGVAGQVWNVATLPWGWWQHRKLCQEAPRLSDHSYTCFFRSPGQLQALTGPVLDHLRFPRGQTLRLTVVAASNGAEVYSLAAWLRWACPHLDFEIQASDHSHALVEQARRGVYPASLVQAQNSPLMPWGEVFDIGAKQWSVRPELRQRVRWSTVDLLKDEVRQIAGAADVVLANNVMFHLTPHQARRAFANVRRSLRPRAALFVQGMDLGLRSSLTREAGLRPLNHEVARIHRDAQKHVDRRWWTLYWGCEPFQAWHPQAARRYSTIFLTP